MINENIYVAVNNKDEVQWVRGSSSKTKYFVTDIHVSKRVEYHNKYYPNDIWRVAKCKLIEVGEG